MNQPLHEVPASSLPDPLIYSPNDVITVQFNPDHQTVFRLRRVQTEHINAIRYTISKAIKGTPISDVGQITSKELLPSILDLGEWKDA